MPKLRLHDVGDIVKHERSERHVRDVFVFTIPIPAMARAEVDGRPPSVSSLPVDGRLEVAAAAPALERTSEDMDVLSMIGRSSLLVAAPVLVKSHADVLPAVGVYDCGMMVFGEYPFALILDAPVFRTVALVAVVVAIGSDVEGVFQDDAYRRWVPGLPFSARDAIFVESSGNREKRTGILVHVVDHPDNDGLALVDGELFGRLVIVVAERDLAAVPLAVDCSGVHDSSYALGCDLALQLGEDQDDLEHGLAHRR